MSSDEVRLVHIGGGVFVWTDAVASTHIALPAAKHAALMRVVAWAESVVGAGEGTPLALCALMNHRKGDYHGALDACPVVERVRADLAATAPGRQGEAPRA